MDDHDEIAGLLDQYRIDPTIGVAGDLLSAAVTLANQRDDIVQIAAEVRHVTNWPLQQVMCDETILGETKRESKRFDITASDSRARVQRLRRVLTVEPRNALRWVDLALEHLTLGHKMKSRDAMRVAINLAPHNRFILRSASALWIELNDPECALATLESSPRSAIDPWLIAPQIAIADLAHVRQTVMRAGQRALENDHSPLALAELRAAIGTVQLGTGAHRRGRQLMRDVLEAPTENALAQVEWSDQRTRELDPIISKMPGDVPRLFEAMARRACYEAKWPEALKHCNEWRRDQPFSVEPYTNESYCACEAEDWRQAISICTEGLALHRRDPFLLNNLAFAEIGMGRLLNAVEALIAARRAPASADAKLTRTATEAMWLFRIGEVIEGRERYLAVIRAFRRLRQRDLAARAALMLTQEEIFADSDFINWAWKEATDLIGRTGGTPGLLQLKNRVEELKNAGPNPEHRIVTHPPTELTAARSTMLQSPELEHI